MCHKRRHLVLILSHLLDHDTSERGVGPAHNGDPQTGRGAGDLHVGHLALQDRQPRDACNDDNNKLQQQNIIIRVSNGWDCAMLGGLNVMIVSSRAGKPPKLDLQPD